MRRLGRLGDEGGQATVEFALVLPILLAVVTMIVNFGITYNHYLALTDAVRAAGRVAAVSRSAADPVGTTQTALTTAANGLSFPTPPSVTWTCPPATPSPCAMTAGQSVTVSASTPYSFSLFGIGLFSGHLTSSTTERIE